MLCALLFVSAENEKFIPNYLDSTKMILTQLSSSISKIIKIRFTKLTCSTNKYTVKYLKQTTLPCTRLSLWSGRSRFTEVEELYLGRLMRCDLNRVKNTQIYFILDVRGYICDENIEKHTKFGFTANKQMAQKFKIFFYYIFYYTTGPLSYSSQTQDPISHLRQIPGDEQLL